MQFGSVAARTMSSEKKRNYEVLHDPIHQKRSSPSSAIYSEECIKDVHMTDIAFKAVVQSVVKMLIVDNETGRALVRYPTISRPIDGV